MFLTRKHTWAKEEPANPLKIDFEAIYNAHKSMVMGTVVRYLRCREDANDVVQETFIAIFKKFDQYDPEKPIKPWIQRIAINCALMYIRQQYRYKLVENELDFDQTSDFEEDVSNEAFGKFTQQELVTILHELPDGYRTVFNLYAIEGLSHQEIAEYLSISESTSRTQLRKARNMIKKLFEHKIKTCYESA